MEKLLFFDIDGTLAYPRTDPSPAAVNSIRSARANGHKVFLSTGRPRESVPAAVTEIGFDGGIFSAGGLVVCADTVLSHRFMPEALVQTVRKALCDDAFFYKLETAEGIFIGENGEEILSRIDLSKAGSEMQRFYEDLFFGKNRKRVCQYRGQPVYKISFFSTDRTKAEHLPALLGGSAKVTLFDNLVPNFPLTAGEVSDFSINKGLALREICRHLGKTEADCIAFGDSMNDAEILRAAGLGIAMGNAEAGVKALADMVCDSCENDGLAKALLTLNLASPERL